jgi:hypothetical protein
VSRSTFAERAERAALRERPQGEKEILFQAEAPVKDGHRALTAKKNVQKYPTVVAEIGDLGRAAISVER